MRLTHLTDLSGTRWLAQSDTPAEQLITLGPNGFPAYARLRYLPDPDRADQLETEANIAADHPNWGALAAQALQILQPHTNTADDCYFCYWEGMPGRHLSDRERAGPMLELPHRRYVVLRGSLRDHPDPRAGSAPPPAFVWPADRRWCFTSDVDPHWAGIGANPAAIAALLADPDIDVVPARPGEQIPRYW